MNGRHTPASPPHPIQPASQPHPARPPCPTHTGLATPPSRAWKPPARRLARRSDSRRSGPAPPAPEPLPRNKAVASVHVRLIDPSSRTKPTPRTRDPRAADAVSWRRCQLATREQRSHHHGRVQDLVPMPDAVGRVVVEGNVDDGAQVVLCEEDDARAHGVEHARALHRDRVHLD